MYYRHLSRCISHGLHLFDPLRSFRQVVVLDGALHLEHSLRRPGWDPMGHGWVGHGKTHGGAG